SELLLQLGELLEARGKPRAALTPLAEAARLAPDSFAVRLARGRVLARLGRIEDAMGELREARRINPHDVAPHWLLGQSCARLGRLSDGLRHYEELLGRRPELRTDALVWRRIGSLKEALGYQLT